MPARRVLGVVLAGGASRRFGSDKLAAALDGRPLVLHAVDSLRAIPGVDGIVLVAPPAPASPAWFPAVRSAGVEVVRDEEAFAGPLAGLARGLGALRDGDVAVVVGGDMPRLDPAVLADLARRILSTAGLDLAFLASGGVTHPLPLAIAIGPARRVADDLLTRGERSLRAFVEAFDRRHGSAEFDLGSLADVDTADDLGALRT